ncbi:SIR2 family protein [Herbaspirillum lusitanum]|uniref:NAD(+) hydrolase ThsA n=1 Tax=Herbaspirillum lusitanum TaxID=213312 RepID=A0ABW9A8H0_9BURK
MNTPNYAFAAEREQRRFIVNFGDKVLNGEAALFVGAGVSRSAGFVDWKALLRNVAEELDLDIGKEHDLLALAQYHVNGNGGRYELNQQLIDAFTRDATKTHVHDILGRLPIDTVWTTNYDQLLEKAYETAGRRVEVKLSIQNLAQARRGRDITLYKMHGCITQPHDAVLTKQDYEIYDTTRRLFTDSLKGDFIEKTLLFLGFSFTDPNVERILAKVREQLGQNQRAHYWITRRPPKICPEGRRPSEDMEYDRRKAELQSADLRRYGIQTIWVDDYADIPHLLRALEAYVMRRGVFVAGAAKDPAPLGRESLDQLSRLLGATIIGRGFNLVSGFGVGIAEQTILGAFHAVYESTQAQPADRILIRPFPGNAPLSTRADAFKRHREDLISRVGAIVVLAGNKADNNDAPMLSPGVEEEVQIALSLGKPIIPVGISGHIARKIWEAATTDPHRYLPGIHCEAELATLGKPDASIQEVSDAIGTLLERAERLASTKN